MIIAQRFPRDEVKSFQRIMTACKRKELAEVSAYQFSRGGTKITGPSVHLLRAIAKRWGNIDFGWTEVSREDGKSLIVAYAWDLETNVRSSISFSVRHWRDTREGGHALKDERDIYELCANQASRRVRASLEAIIDEDIVNSALEECEKSLKSGHSEPLEDRIKKMVSAFSGLSVSQAMLEKRLQHKIDAASEGELVQLRRIYTSITDGMSKREEWFDVGAVANSQDSTPKESIPSTPAKKKEDAKPAATPPADGEGDFNKMATPVAPTQPQSPPPNEPTTEPPPASDDAEVKALVEQIGALAVRDGVNEDQILAYGQKNKLIGKMCTGVDMMATSKMKILIEQWPHIVDKIKAYPRG